MIVTLVVLAVLVGGAYVAAQVALSNSYFVGANEQGRVAIFSGIRDEVAGLTLNEEKEASGVEVSELPEFKQQDVREGITADSLADARAIVQGLEGLASDPDFGSNRRRESKDNNQKDANQ